jgi:hypothetical protein
LIWAVAGDETAAIAANPVRPAASFVKWVIVLSKHSSARKNILS